MAKVGIDLDGVLYDFHIAFLRYLTTSGNDSRYNIKKSFNDWSFFTKWGMSNGEFAEHCNNGVDAGIIFRGPARKRAGSAIRRIKRAGHEIHIVTDRSWGSSPLNSQHATLDWLAEHQIPYDSITFSPDKTVVPTDFFVEDKLENYDALDKAGTRVYLISRPWNKRDDNRRRISGITEFANIVTGRIVV